MGDTITLDAAAFFWLMFGMMVVAAAVTWLALWGHYRQKTNAAIDQANRELEARSVDLPGVRIERIDPAGDIDEWRAPGRWGE